MIFVAKSVFCQNSTGKTVPPYDFYTFKQGLKNDGGNNINQYFHKITGNKPIQAIHINISGLPLNPTSVSVISADYYTQNFGLFCKKELQFEKATKVPFKFRLGSVQYCDWMEGKKTAGILSGH